MIKLWVLTTPDDKSIILAGPGNKQQNHLLILNDQSNHNSGQKFCQSSTNYSSLLFDSILLECACSVLNNVYCDPY